MKYEKVESNTKPNLYRIGYVIGNQIQLAFSDEIEEFTRKDENDEEITVYRYYEYIIKVYNREKEELIANVEANLEEWKQFAKDNFIKEKSAEIRAIRNKLLAESDQYFLLDRIGLQEKITTDNLLNTLYNVITGEWAQYRQALRDIPLQDKFPYEVDFPIKPTETKEESTKKDVW